MNMLALPLDEAADCLRALPLGGLLIQLADEGRSGSLLIHDAGSEPLAVLYLRAGVITMGRVRTSGGALLECLAPLCARTGDRFSFVEDENLLAAERDVLAGPVDTLQLLASAMRGAVRDDLVALAIRDLGEDLLKLSPHADPARYGFTPNEQRIVACLDEPSSLAELARSTRLPAHLVRRVLYLLLATRAVTRLPPWRRVASGAVMHAPALPGPAAAPRNDEPTRVAPLSLLALSASPNRTMTHWPPADAIGEDRRRDSGAPPDEVSNAGDSTGRYCVRHPEHADTIPPRSSRPPSRSKPASEIPSPAAEGDASLHFRAAEILLARGDIRNAVFEAQKAMKLRAPRPAEQAFYAWLLYQRAGAGARAHAHVWNHLEAARLADPNCARVQHFKRLLLESTAAAAAAIDGSPLDRSDGSAA